MDAKHAPACRSRFCSPPRCMHLHLCLSPLAAELRMPLLPIPGSEELDGLSSTVCCQMADVTPEGCRLHLQASAAQHAPRRTTVTHHTGPFHATPLYAPHLFQQCMAVGGGLAAPHTRSQVILVHARRVTPASLPSLTPPGRAASAAGRVLGAPAAAQWTARPALLVGWGMRGVFRCKWVGAKPEEAGSKRRLDSNASPLVGTAGRVMRRVPRRAGSADTCAPRNGACTTLARAAARLAGRASCTWRPCLPLPRAPPSPTYSGRATPCCAAAPSPRGRAPAR
jgi:hypothetical protein